MTTKIMTVRDAGRTPAPGQLGQRIVTIKRLGKDAQEKIWKKLVATFTRVPSRAEIQQKTDFIENYYEKGRKIYEDEQKKKFNDPTIRITIKIKWKEINPLKYYILIIMIKQGPGDTSLQPPKSPAPPHGPL